jgi:2,3-bisphosphoglycerate-dependent phosphoglycerate mutase
MHEGSQRRWPQTLWLVRHGQSAGNVANDAALAAGLPTIEVAGRDVDVPLSPLGQRQADALGSWFRDQPDAHTPTIVLTSPYARARQTAQLLLARLPESGRPSMVLDERLREKELGSLNRLTRTGILAKFPAEAELRQQIGKFYYRPPGGESWCDVILRLRNLLDGIRLQYAGERVLIMTHQVVVLCFRYLIEQMSEEDVLRIDRASDVANCSLTTYHATLDVEGRGQLALESYNVVTPLEEAGQPVTETPDPATVPR